MSEVALVSCFSISELEIMLAASIGAPVGPRLKEQAEEGHSFMSIGWRLWLEMHRSFNRVPIQRKDKAFSRGPVEM